MSRVKAGLELGKGATKYAGKKIKEIVQAIKTKRKRKAWTKANKPKIRALSAKYRKQTKSTDPYNRLRKSVGMRSNIPHRAQTQKGSSFKTVNVKSQEHAKWLSRVGLEGRLKPIDLGPSLEALFRAGVTKGTKKDRILTRKYLRNKLTRKHSKGEFIMPQKYGYRGYGQARTHGMGLEDEQLKPGKIYKAKQGVYAREDESIGMRLGKKKTKHDKKVARDESYGKWGKRAKDWKKASQGYYAREDESIAMRKKKKRTHKQLVASRDESYGDWGKRKRDWKKKVIKARGGVSVKTKLNGTLFTHTY
jgi:hypothetical protein